jgi:hypothetical protein
MIIFDLLKKFDVKIPITLEYSEDGTDSVLVFDDKATFIVRRDIPGDELIEYVARLKLGENEKLLGTFYFDDEPGIDDLKQKFAAAAGPLQKAWTFRIVKEYDPDMYQRELDDMMEMVRKVKFRSTEKPLVAWSKEFWLMLDLAGVIYADPANEIELNLFNDTNISEDKIGQVANERSSVTRYLGLLKEYAQAKPDPELYCKITEALFPEIEVILWDEEHDGIPTGRHSCFGVRKAYKPVIDDDEDYKITDDSPY